MHSALQTLAHLPQWVHWLLLMTILKMANLEMNPKNVPTGQTVLQ
jgi:hypothetical protein